MCLFMPYEFTVSVLSESSMYLPVTPIKSKHRRPLNLLEVPHPQLCPHVKPNKVSTFTYFLMNLCHPL